MHQYSLAYHKSRVCQKLPTNLSVLGLVGGNQENALYEDFKASHQIGKLNHIFFFFVEIEDLNGKMTFLNKFQNCISLFKSLGTIRLSKICIFQKIPKDSYLLNKS